jgi:hypothetical protein
VEKIFVNAFAAPVVVGTIDWLRLVLYVNLCGWSCKLWSVYRNEWWCRLVWCRIARQLPSSWVLHYLWYSSLEIIVSVPSRIWSFTPITTVLYCLHLRQLIRLLSSLLRLCAHLNLQKSCICQ